MTPLCHTVLYITFCTYQPEKRPIWHNDKCVLQEVLGFEVGGGGRGGGCCHGTYCMNCGIVIGLVYFKQRGIFCKRLFPSGPGMNLSKQEITIIF